MTRHVHRRDDGLRHDAPEGIARFSVVPAEGTTLASSQGLAISPDGSRIVFAAYDDSGEQRLPFLFK